MIRMRTSAITLALLCALAYQPVRADGVLIQIDFTGFAYDADELSPSEWGDSDAFVYRLRAEPSAHNPRGDTLPSANLEWTLQQKGQVLNLRGLLEFRMLEGDTADFAISTARISKKSWGEYVRTFGKDLGQSEKDILGIPIKYPGFVVNLLCKGIGAALDLFRIGRTDAVMAAMRIHLYVYRGRPHLEFTGLDNCSVRDTWYVSPVFREEGFVRMTGSGKYHMTVSVNGHAV
ncbi:MAG TPA: hypothetical protein VHI13_19025 [Candidatus Kapabacteria bacterium]|nr:hypothetical protein [Candidatus Kapabacteria bacterium]